MTFSKKQIPNYLTYLRVILVVPIIILLLVSSDNAYHITISNKVSDFSITWLLGSILFVIAAITDWIDGYLARKYNWISNTGKFLDPVADKVVINSVLIILAVQSYIPVWLVIILIARDIFVDGSRMVLSKKEVVLAANIYGKLKTITQFFAILIILFVIRFKDGVLQDYYFHIIQNLLVYLATFLSLLSGWNYIWTNRKLIFEK